MRISDVSSDVCSSDLAEALEVEPTTLSERPKEEIGLGHPASAHRLGRDPFRRIRRLIDLPFHSFVLWFCNRPGSWGEGRGCLWRSEEHTSELQSLMRISYAVFCLKKNKIRTSIEHIH